MYIYCIINMVTVNMQPRKFLFKCNDCEMIVSVSFDNKEDLDKVQEGEMVLECVCEGRSTVLLD